MINHGMPCIRLGPRRTRFDLEEVLAWLKDHFGQQRRAPVRAITASPRKEAA
jgi:hypothetical protein